MKWKLPWRSEKAGAEATETDESLPKAGDEAATAAESPPAKTSIRVIEAHLTAARRHSSEHRYNAALDEIMAVLDVYPKNREARDLAQIILYLGSSARAEERLRPGIGEDPLFDSLFNQCNRCHRSWPGNPMYKDVEHLTVTNPVGGRCPACGRVWCRQCADGQTFLSCPECHEQLEIIREPAGRRRGLGPARHPDLKLLQAFVFKAPPEPRRASSYISIVLDALCPEFFQSGASIHFNTGEAGADDGAAIAYSYAYAMSKGIECSAEHTFVERFSDADGGQGVLVTLYEPLNR
jgi:hypothetical protein